MGWRFLEIALMPTWESNRNRDKERESQGPSKKYVGNNGPGEDNNIPVLV